MRGDSMEFLLNLHDGKGCGTGNLTSTTIPLGPWDSLGRT